MADLELAYVRHGDIIGLDPVVADFLHQVGFEPDDQLSVADWDPMAAEWIYFTSPVIVSPRKAGYCVLGSGRAWRLAEQLFKDCPRRVNSDQACRLNSGQGL